MPPHVQSVNVGTPAPAVARRAGTTGIDKHPVAELAVRDPGPRNPAEGTSSGGSGGVGDHIGNRRHHGGTDQAVYLVAVEELEHWADELDRPLAPGIFGENLTTRGLDVDALVVGTRLHVGAEVVLEVRLPREPCATFSAHMGERGWLRRFAERGRTGAYCAVIVPGTIRPDDGIEVVDVPDHGIDVVDVFRATMGDLELARTVLDAGVLHPPYDAELASVVQARTR